MINWECFTFELQSILGILKTNRCTLNSGEEFEDVLEDEPHTLYIFMDDTKLAHSFKPAKTNEFVVATEDNFLRLKDQDGNTTGVEIVKFEQNDFEVDDDDDW